MEKYISAVHARKKFPELLRGVRQGRSYIVTSHGKPVAKLIPADSDSVRAQAAHAAFLRKLRAQKPAKGASARHRWTRDELYDDPH